MLVASDWTFVRGAPAALSLRQGARFDWLRSEAAPAVSLCTTAAHSSMCVLLAGTGAGAAQRRCSVHVFSPLGGASAGVHHYLSTTDPTRHPTTHTATPALFRAKFHADIAPIGGHDGYDDPSGTPASACYLLAVARWGLTGRRLWVPAQI